MSRGVGRVDIGVALRSFIFVELSSQLLRGQWFIATHRRFAATSLFFCNVRSAAAEAKIGVLMRWSWGF
jgi:hypothetical protein